MAQSPGYLETIHLPLLEGRAFNETDGTAYHEAAIFTRDAAARLWPGQNPMGKRFRLFDNKNKATAWITVVGISADIRQEIQENDPRPLLFVPYRQEGYGNMAVVVESATDPLPAMRTTVQSLDPELPLNDPSVVKDALEHRTWFLRVFGRIFLGFALIAMLMASVGIYAVIAHAMNGRTQEIGVRLALGATMRNIMLLVMKRGLWQIGCGACARTWRGTAGRASHGVPTLRHSAIECSDLSDRRLLPGVGGRDCVLATSAACRQSRSSQGNSLRITSYE